MGREIFENGSANDRERGSSVELEDKLRLAHDLRFRVAIGL